MPATPLGGPAVAEQAGAWLNNFHAHPVLWLAPAIGFVGMIFGAIALQFHLKIIGWWLGVLSWVGTISTVGIAMFPFLMPSSTAPAEASRFGIPQAAPIILAG